VITITNNSDKTDSDVMFNELPRTSSQHHAKMTLLKSKAQLSQAGKHPKPCW
jgi:hypothetical protein